VDGRRIRDILIVDKTQEGNRRIITAGDARLDASPQQAGVISLTLDHVLTQLSYPKDGDRYDYTLSDSLVYSILLKNISTVSIGGLTPSTMSSADVWKQIRLKARDQQTAEQQKTEKVAGLAFALAGGLRAAERQAAANPGQLPTLRTAVETVWRGLYAEQGWSVADLSLQSYRVEFHRKFSMPIGCLVFAFFAFPVGVRARRSGRTVGVRMSLSPAFSMWFPDAVVLAAGIAFFLRGARR
jgi:lipopolysaccharide export system permease protein